MLRLSILTAAALSLASAAQAQLVNPKAYLEVNLGALMPSETSEDTLSYKEKVTFNTSVQGSVELGARTEINPTVKGVGLVGISYGSTSFDQTLDLSTTPSTITNDSDVNTSIVSYYVGGGVEYSASPRLTIGGNVKVGGSSINIDSYAATQRADVDNSNEGTVTYASEDNSGFMWGPELKLTYQMTDQIDLVGTGNTQFHFIDSDRIAADQLNTYFVSGGLRFNFR